MKQLFLNLSFEVKKLLKKIDILFIVYGDFFYRYGSLVYFLMMFYKLQNVQVLKENDMILNSNLIQIQRVWFTVSVSLFFVTSFFKNKIINKFLFFTTLITVLYGMRLTQTYLFQDDWFHTLAISRLGWEGLWIPFVDHVTPIWRGIQFFLIKLVGGYDYIKYLPYVGVIGMASLSTFIYYLFLKKRVKLAFLYSLLLATYPGYPSVMFWISTNAIVYSAIFGLFGVYLHYLYSENRKSYYLYIIFLNFVISYMAWTTGLVFPLFSGFIFLMNNAKKIFSKKIFSSLGWIVEGLPALAALIVFFVVRITAYKIFTESYVAETIWIANGIKHWHEQNILRPILWPFVAIFDGIVIKGIFDTIYLYHPFWQFLLRGFLFAVLIVMTGNFNKRARKYHIHALIFLFVSYAIIFYGRGIGPISSKDSHGFLDYPISNDWYRISSVGGMIFILALASKYYSKITLRRLKRIVLLVLLPLFLGFIGPNSHFRDHNIRKITLELSGKYQALECLKKIKLSQDDYLYASEYVYLPMYKSNPGSYWLGYEPSWFDVFLDGSRTSKFRFLFDQEKQELIETQLRNACPQWPVEFEKYVIRTEYPYAEWHTRSKLLKYEKNESTLRVFDVDDQKDNIYDDFKNYSLLVLKLKALEDREITDLVINDRKYPIPLVQKNWKKSQELFIAFDLKFLNKEIVKNGYFPIEIVKFPFDVMEIRLVALPSSTKY